MPIGKPAPDGEGIVPASRFGRAAGEGLGPAGPWKCPACGVQNDGRIERGCVHCGSGDPTKSRAGKPSQPAPSPELAQAAAQDLVQRAKQAAHEAKAAGGNRVVATGQPQAQRILRLIEYLVKPGQNADDVLRNSLVGRMEFAWGTLTGTIVDSADLRQEDLLQLARRQPGVWLANPGAVVLQAALSQGKVAAPVLSPADERRVTADLQTRMYRMPLPPADLPDTTTPDTGVPFDIEDKRLAWSLIELGGYVLAHTIALALGTVAEELESNADEGRLLSKEKALSLASAIMFLIPDEWLTPEPQPAAPIDPARQAAIDRVRDAGKPTTTPWVDPTTPGVTRI